MLANPQPGPRVTTPSLAEALLQRERRALYDDATQPAAYQRLEAAAWRRSASSTGPELIYWDGSVIAFNVVGGSVTARTAAERA